MTTTTIPTATPITAAAATAFTQANYAGDVGTAVAVKSADAQRQAGASALKLLEGAAAIAAPARASTAATNGVGGTIDEVG